METAENGRNPDGTFAPGNPGGPGRPVLTEEQRAKKQAIAEYVAEYKEILQELLPIVPQSLKKKIESGDINAIKELHERTLGKVEQKTDITSGGQPLTPVLVKFINGESDRNTS